MSPHRFDPDSAAALEELARFRYLSRDELVAALDPDPGDVVGDIGSGTGFYTREIAPFVGEIHAVDMQEQMHEHFRDHGLPENVTQVLAKADDMPFEDGFFDGLYSTMTFHEYDDGGVDELHRVLDPGGRLVVADWSQTGDGERGPPLEARFDTPTATDIVERAGFEIESARSRPETFFIEAVRE
jgi:ubiquinone/menaquinone biosynthesis C-methylase UbiE